MAMTLRQALGDTKPATQPEPPSPFVTELRVPLLVSRADAMQIEQGKGPADTYEVEFKAVLRAKDLALVFGMSRDHKVLAVLSSPED